LPAVLGTVCRSIAAGVSRSAKKARSIKWLFVARGMARGLLTKPRDHLDEHMIAQPVLTTGPKPQAQQQQQQQQNSGGFQSLLSTTDSSLMDLATNTGASATTTAQPPANSNKPKNNDPSATPYIAAAPQPSPIQPSAAQPGPTPPGVAPASTIPPALLSDGKALDANAVPNNAVIPAADASASAAADQNGSNGTSTAFGADALNARIVAGAPIYASQPNASMATVPPHLLDAANAHPLPGEPAGKPGDTTNGKAPADATLPPSAANAAGTPAAPSLPNHPPITAPAGNGANNGDSGGTPAQTADSGATDAANDPSTPNASLLAQPNQSQSAPIQVDAAARTAAPYVPVGEQVALNLKQAIAGDNNEVRIQLKPASLGTIDVKLNVGQDGRVSAVISADRTDTLNMLKQDAGTLQQALRDAGLNADSSSLSFNLSSDAQSFAQNWSQNSGGTNSGGNAYAGTASNALVSTDAIAPAQRLHAGALDIEV
jgi:hypothetical protein